MKTHRAEHLGCQVYQGSAKSYFQAIHTTIYLRPRPVKIAYPKLNSHIEHVKKQHLNFGKKPKVSAAPSSENTRLCSRAQHNNTTLPALGGRLKGPGPGPPAAADTSVLFAHSCIILSAIENRKLWPVSRITPKDFHQNCGVGLPKPRKIYLCLLCLFRFAF